MASRRLLPRALVLVVSGLLAALPAGTGLAAVVPPQAVRADSPVYPTWDGSLNGGSSNAAAPAGVVDLADAGVGGLVPNPDPASVTATAGTGPIQGAAILQSDLTGSNLADTSVRSLHLENLPVQIPLSTIPFTRSTSPKNWQDLLSGTILAGVPLQNVTWSQVTQLAPAPAGLDSITMADVDWSGSVLANLPLDAFTFGGTDITTIQIPLQPGEPSSDTSAADRWCYALDQAQAGSCPSPASLAGKSLLGVSIQGASLQDLPLHNIPLHNIDLTNSPLHNIPLHNIVLEVSSLKNLPLHNIDMVNSPLHNIPLHNIDLSTSPLHNIPLHNIDWVASPLHNIPLHNINLATSPVGTIPLHNIDFANAPLHNIPLHNIDPTASGLGAMPLSAIAWGSAQIGTSLLSQVTIPGGPLDPILLSATANPASIDAACATTCPAGETLGTAATNHEILSTATLADIGGTAFGSVTLGQLLAGSSLTPTLGDLRLDLAGPGAPPLTVAGLESALSASATPIMLGDLELDDASGVNALVLGDLSDYLSDQTTFDTYLLGDIGTYTDNTGHEITLGELGIWTDNTGADITLGELAQYLDDFVSLGDVLLGLVPPDQFPYENFPISSLSLNTPGRSILQPSSAFMAGYGSHCATTGSAIGAGFITNLPTCFAGRLLATANPDNTPTDPVMIDATLPAGAQFLSVVGQTGYTVGTPQVSLQPDGQQLVAFEFPSIAAGGLSSFEFTYENSLTLGANNVHFDMRSLDGTLIGSQDVDSPAVQDAAEPNSPIEDPSIYGSGKSSIISLPVNPDACSSLSSDCTGLGSTYIDAMVAGYISYKGDLDWYALPNVKAGSRISADLTDLPLDADLVLYGPSGITTSPTLFPPSTSKLPGLLVEDPGLGVGQAAHSIATQALGDLQLDQGYISTLTGSPVPVPPMTPISISQHRGTDPESVGAIAPEDGTYVVAVTGYNGATSNSPYLLRARVTAPPAEATCPARSFSNYGAAGAIPTIGSNVNALFLTDPGRIVATYGQAAEDGIEAQLGALVTYLNANPQLGVVPAVIPIEAYPGVADAYMAWDLNPCSVSLANAVVAQITGVIHTIRAGAPGISYITILGGDDIVPMGRTPDLTRVSNESEYASTFDVTNPISAAEAASETLTDDVYGDPSPTPTGDGNNLFVPQMAVGRLVESPADIDSQLASYVTNHGTLDTKTGLVAGYDFLADGAQAVADRLASGDGGRTIDDTLIDQPGASPGWNNTDLLTHLFPTGGTSPEIDSINAHYDHSELEPSAVNAGTSSTLVSDSTLVGAGGPGALVGHLLFTMGCHAGLSVPDAYVPGTSTADAALKLDWAQALSQAGVSIYVANTGYGIGDTTSVAYSERIMGLYAKELDGSLTAGQALVYAKQAYYGSLGAVGVYDLKVLQQVAYYGLPFWYVGAAPTGSTPPPPPTAPAPPGAIGPDPVISGLQSASLTVSSTFTQKNVTGRGSFWVVNGPGGTTLDPQVTQYEPIQPATSESVVASGLTAHGALITALTSHDMSNVNPVLNTPTIDLSASSPEVKSGDAAWPASIASITNSRAPYGRAQSLVLVPGQFLGSTSDGTGRQRLFDSVGVSVLYGSPSSTDFNAPTIATSSAAAAGSSVTFTVSATDAEGPVARVLAGFHDFDGSWKFVDLSLQSDGSWSGIGTANHSFGPTDGIEYFIQAVDAAGNVSTASNKAANFAASTDTTPPTITASVSPAPNGAGWSKTAETVTFSCSDGGSGIAPGTCPAPVGVSADGSTTVTQSVSDRAGNTASATAVVQIDQTAPSISATVSPPPNASGWSSAASETVTFSCSDGGSGLATACPAPVTVSNEGTTPVSGSVTDVAGNTASASVSVELDRTAPTIGAAVVPVPNANGWNNGASAKVTFTCGDTGSGVASGTGACPGAVTVSTEGVTSLNASVSDQAGNLATIVATVRIDRTLPTISAMVTPAPNASGWSNAASETVHFSCGDSGSGVAAPGCPADQTVTAEGSTTVSGTVLDLAGNSATKSVVVKLDRTPPTIKATISPTPNSAGWLILPLAKVSFTCSDGGSGLASGACPAPVLVTSQGITQVTRTVTDVVGNIGSVTATVRIDSTLPVVTLTGYPLHPVCTTTDALSGVKVAASLNLATARVAGIPVTVATCLGALDVAGNPGLPVVRTYVAPITFSGFQAPVVGPPTVNTGSVSKAYPVKFQLRDAGGAFITALPAISSTSYQSVSCTTFGSATSALPAGTNASTSLAYDSKANQYVYTWKTPSSAGCYVLTIGLADGTSYKANFKLK